MKAKARMQINLQLSKVDDIKQVAGIRDMVFPLFWFESVSFYLFIYLVECLFGILYFDIPFYMYRELINCQKT